MNNTKRLQEIEKELKLINEAISKKEKTDPDEGWDEYCIHMKSEWDAHNKLDREKRMLMTPEFNDLPDYGDVISLKNFVECVKAGYFIDYDGSGNYVRDSKESNIIIYPSDVRYDSIRDDFDTIIWFNR